MSITKNHIAKHVASHINISKKDSLRFLDYLLNKIKNNLNKADVKINKFGTFTTKVTPKRLGRNPATKEEFIIPSIKKPAFKVSSNIKDSIN